MRTAPQKPSKIRDFIQSIRDKSVRFWRVVSQKTLSFVDKRPLVSFFTILGLLLVVMIIGNIIRQPKGDIAIKVRPPKLVEVYSIGESPTVQVSAKIEKSGTITLVAQTAGVVQQIQKQAGDTMLRGESMFWLSTNYQGGNIPTTSRQLAQTNFDFVKSNFDAQTQMITKRRDIASLSDGQADKLRDIVNQSIGDTQQLISLNEEIITSINAQLALLESTNVGGINDSAISETKQAKIGVLTGLLSLKSALRNSEYQASSDKEPARLSDVSRELTIQQLDLEERSLKLNMEMSKLNLRIAQIGESLMYPASPVNGTVQRVWVNVGDTVTPGTVLATISANKSTVSAVALVTRELASSLSRIQTSKLMLPEGIVELFPRFISTEATDGALHSVLFTLPESASSTISDNSYVIIKVPISTKQTTSAVPYIPLDAVYQTQTDAYVFLASPSGTKTYTAQSQKITLGTVTGSYVQVNKGLKAGSQVILNRNVLAGDTVTLQ